jgi:hypothetical protein
MQELGADQVVDYSSQCFEEVYKDRPFDGIIDVIGGESPWLSRAPCVAEVWLVPHCWP